MNTFLNIGLAFALILFFGTNATEIKVLDDFSTDSRSEYVSSYKNATFDLPETNWRISDHKLYPFPVDREKQWKNDASTKRGAMLFRKNERLLPGQAIAVTVGFSSKNWKYPKLGLAVENASFTITPGESGYFLFVGGKEYDLELPLKVKRDIEITLVRGKGKASNNIYWTAIGNDLAKRGEFEIEDIPEKAHFGLVFHAGYSEEQREMYLSNLKHGTMACEDLPEIAVAELTMRSKMPPLNSNKSKLILENKNGALSKKELQSLVDWALNEPGQWSNHGNRALARHVDLYKVYKVYDKTRDVRILDHLVEIAQMALDSRNDRNKVIGSFKTLTGYKNGRWTYDIGPTWPHFMGWNEQDGERYYHGDAGEDAVGVHYLALAARAIAETPDVWNKQVGGLNQTYIEIARNFVNEAIVTVEKSIIPKYIEPETMEAIYQYRRSLPGKSVLDIGGYVPFNRFWHVPVAFVSLCPAMEILQVQKERVATYDKISDVSIQRWLKSMDHLVKEGKELIDYPYCYPSERIYKNEPEKWDFMPSKFKGFPSEDLNHMGCDASQLYIFHFSNRYEVPEDILRKWANALILNTSKESTEYLSYRLNGTGYGKMKSISADAYFLSLFQPEIEKYFWENPHSIKKDLERQVLFLKLLKKVNN